MKSTEHEPSLPRLQDSSRLVSAPSLKWNVTRPCGIRAEPLDVFLTVAVAVYLQTGIPFHDELAVINTVVSARVLIGCGVFVGCGVLVGVGGFVGVGVSVGTDVFVEAVVGGTNVGVTVGADVPQAVKAIITNRKTITNKNERCMFISPLRFTRCSPINNNASSGLLSGVWAEV